MDNVNKRYTVGKLELRKFTFSDCLYLLVYCFAVGYTVFLSIHDSKEIKLVSLFISLIIGFFTISSPFGLRFRNVYFSILWLTLSIIFLISNDLVAVIPLSSFLLYHLLRAMFWKQHNKEFVPYEVGRGAIIQYKSNFEGRSGTAKDKVYTQMLLWIGLALIGLIFIASELVQ
jgi:hypothetical protein